jgi:hypothetical protein
MGISTAGASMQVARWVKEGKCEKTGHGMYKKKGLSNA